jgi:hypothetical protein
VSDIVKRKYCDKVINLCHKENLCAGLRAVNKKEEEEFQTLPSHSG